MLRSAILIGVLTTTPSVFSATHKVPDDEPVVTIEIPDEWQTKDVGESLQATAPAEPVHVLVVPPEGTKIAETMGEAMRYIRNSGGIMVKGESRKDQSGKLSGMDVKRVSWDAKDKNGEIRIEFTIAFLTERKRMLVACWGSPKGQEKYETALKGILQSIKKIPPTSHDGSQK